MNEHFPSQRSESVCGAQYPCAARKLKDVKVVIADTTIGRVAEAAACADKFKKCGVDITLTV